MLRGEKIGLRARHETDIPILMAELYDDVPTRSAADTRPWRPITEGDPKGPYRVEDMPENAVPFSVVELATGELVGDALLWEIDTHNRSAHLGLGLRPSFRGRGFGADLVRVLCEYGFTVRGLQRLQVDTLAVNAPMIGAARRAGFTLEGTMRRAAWVCGRYEDVVLLGLLDEEWAAAQQS